MYTDAKRNFGIDLSDPLVQEELRRLQAARASGQLGLEDNHVGGGGGGNEPMSPRSPMPTSFMDPRSPRANVVAYSYAAHAQHPTPPPSQPPSAPSSRPSSQPSSQPSSSRRRQPHAFSFSHVTQAGALPGADELGVGASSNGSTGATTSKGMRWMLVYALLAIALAFALKVAGVV
jgi:hypothetical protein